jgi:hypothetical protein
VGLSAALAVFALGAGPAGADESGACPKKKAAAKPPATAAAPAETAKAPAATPAETAGQAGMKAYIDPATGKLREPNADDAALAAAATKGRQAQAVRPEPVILQRPGGGRIAVLGEEYLEDVVVWKNADGTLTFQCAPRSQQKRAVEEPAANPAPPARPELEKE